MNERKNADTLLKSNMLIKISLDLGDILKKSLENTQNPIRKQ